MLKRLSIVIAAVLVPVPLVWATAALGDHAPATLSSPVGIPTDTPVGKSGDWSYVGNFPMGPGIMQELGSDAETFVRGGKRHTIVGSMTLGFRLFRYDDLGAKPVPVAD